MGNRGYGPDRSSRFTRRSLRLPKHNYSWTGAYFVTIRAALPEPLFDIPELRAILVKTWNELGVRFPSITQDEFIVMPDHVHFIVLLDDTVENPPKLSGIVQVYKSITTVAWLNHLKTTELQCPGRFWQRNYFERVIRDAQELDNTRQYIRNNPIKLHSPDPKDMH